MESKERKDIMYSKTIAVGRLTKDPVEKGYGSDGKMSLFTIAVDTGRDETQFYDCVAFGKTAENINKFFSKGRPILVEGHFQNNNREKTTPGGETYQAYEMNFLVRAFSFVGDSGGQQNQGGQQQQQQQQNYGQQQQQGGFQNNFAGKQDNNPFAGFPSDDDMPF